MVSASRYFANLYRTSRAGDPGSSDGSANWKSSTSLNGAWFVNPMLEPLRAHCPE